MFYCDPCAAKINAPEVMTQSWGSCEVCGVLRACNNHPVSKMPDLSTDEVTQFDMDSTEDSGHVKSDLLPDPPGTLRCEPEELRNFTGTLHDEFGDPNPTKETPAP